MNIWEGDKYHYWKKKAMMYNIKLLDYPTLITYGKGDKCR